MNTSEFNALFTNVNKFIINDTSKTNSYVTLNSGADLIQYFISSIVKLYGIEVLKECNNAITYKLYISSNSSEIMAPREIYDNLFIETKTNTHTKVRTIFNLYSLIDPVWLSNMTFKFEDNQVKIEITKMINRNKRKAFIVSASLTDEKSKKDALKRENMAKSLAQVLLSCKTHLNVGLFSAWGNGKSSFINMIKSEVQDLASQQSKIVHFVTIDATHCSTEEELWSLMIKSLCNAYILPPSSSIFSKVLNWLLKPLREFNVYYTLSKHKANRLFVSIILGAIVTYLSWQTYRLLDVESLKSNLDSLEFVVFPTLGFVSGLAYISAGLKASYTKMVNLVSETSGLLDKFYMSGVQVTMHQYMTALINLVSGSSLIRSKKSKQVIMAIDEIDRCNRSMVPILFKAAHILNTEENITLIISINHTILASSLIECKEVMLPVSEEEESSQNNNGNLLDAKTYATNLYIQKYIHIPIFLDSLSHEAIDEFDQLFEKFTESVDAEDSNVESENNDDMVPVSNNELDASMSELEQEDDQKNITLSSSDWRLTQQQYTIFKTTMQVLIKNNVRITARHYKRIFYVFYLKAYLIHFEFHNEIETTRETLLSQGFAYWLSYELNLTSDSRVALINNHKNSLIKNERIKSVLKWFMDDEQMGILFELVASESYSSSGNQAFGSTAS